MSDSAILTQLCCLKEQLRQPNTNHFVVDNDTELSVFEVCDIIPASTCSVTSDGSHTISYDLQEGTATFSSITDDIFGKTCNIFEGKYIYIAGNKLLTSKITVNEFGLYVYKDINHPDSDEIINSTSTNIYYFYKIDIPEKIVPLKEVFCFTNCNLTNRYYIDLNTQLYTPKGVITTCPNADNVTVDNEYEYVDIGNFYDPIDSSEYKAVQTYKNGILTDTKFYSYPSLLLQTTIVPPNQNTLYIPVDTTYNGIYQLNTINQVATFEVNKFKDISIQSLSGVGTILIEDGDKVSNITLLPGYNISYSSNRLLKSKIVVTATSSDANIIVAYITPYPNQVI